MHKPHTASQTMSSANNRCHVKYFDLAVSLSLNSLLTKSQVLFVILEGNLCLGLSSVGYVYTVSSWPGASDRLWLAYSIVSSVLTLSELQPERLS